MFFGSTVSIMQLALDVDCTDLPKICVSEKSAGEFCAELLFTYVPSSL